MPTIKLVLIGSSGVGKTSLRNQFVSGRFSSGYRATIGADFVTKKLPYPKRSIANGPSHNKGDRDDVVSLQIWDTAGQERFSTLSSAFFRGSDAVLIVFDAGRKETVRDLGRWWEEFKQKRPLEEGNVERGFCVGVVGNKVDLVGEGGVGVGEVENVVRGIFGGGEEGRTVGSSSSGSALSPDMNTHARYPTHQRTRTRSIDIVTPPRLKRGASPSARHHNLLASSSWLSSNSKRRSRSTGSMRAHHGSSTSMSTIVTTATATGTVGSGNTTYHTPSSSFFDVYEDARTSLVDDEERDEEVEVEGARKGKGRLLSITSRSDSSGASASTITPSLFAARNRRGDTQVEEGEEQEEGVEVGARVFWTSAKSGEGVGDVFEYVAKRVVKGWESEERVGSGQQHRAGLGLRVGNEYSNLKGRDPGIRNCCS